MPTPEPLVGIALAVYRPELSAFRQQLDSLRAQTHGHWRCVLTCDSPLAELEAAPELAEHFADPRFHWVENPRRLGPKDNFARAIALTLEHGARYVGCADQDDVWYPEKIATLVAALADKPPLALVHADMDVLVGDSLLARSAWELEQRAVERPEPTRLLVRNVVTGAAMLMDAELPRRFPTIPDGVLHDHFYAVLASLHGGVHPVPRRLHAYRQHDQNVIGVRPYRGLLDGLGPRELLAKRDDAIGQFRGRRALARALESAGLPLDDFQRLAFTQRIDAGLALAGLGLTSLRDRPLARESFALAAGKLLWVLRRADP